MSDDDEEKAGSEMERDGEERGVNVSGISEAAITDDVVALLVMLLLVVVVAALRIYLNQ